MRAVTSEGDTKHRHPIIDPDDVDTVISTKWLIDGLVPLQEISLVFGPPKNLKTFLVLALLLCVATGREFFGRKVHRAKVLYIIGEGTNAFLGRIKAWQKLNDVPSLENHFKYDRRMIDLFADDGVDCAQAVFDAMQAQGFRPDVVAIDTLGRAMGGAKETTEDFNKIFATLDAMAQDYWPGVTLVIVSHTRKADMTYRGPQVIAGDCDNMIYVERLEKELEANVHCQFFRNAAEFDNFGFTCAPEEASSCHASSFPSAS
jgi:RecA-family ATPase